MRRFAVRGGGSYYQNPQLVSGCGWPQVNTLDKVGLLHLRVLYKAEGFKLKLYHFGFWMYCGQLGNHQSASLAGASLLRRVTLIPQFVPNKNEGAPGPSPFGTGDGRQSAHSPIHSPV